MLTGIPATNVLTLWCILIKNKLYKYTIYNYIISLLSLIFVSQLHSIFFFWLILKYLIELRHGDNFVNVSGPIWWFLFVFLFMPYLRRYRLSSSVKYLTGQTFFQELVLKRFWRDIDLQEKFDCGKEVQFIDIQDDQEK